MRCAAYLVICLTVSCSYGKGGEEHIVDIQAAFGWNDSSYDICSYISQGMDYGTKICTPARKTIADQGSSFYKMLQAEFGSLNGVGLAHRAYGHWGMNGPIPQEFLEAMEENFPGCKKRVLEIWTDFVKTRRDAVKMTLGLVGDGSDKVAQALSAIASDIHVLGDFTTISVDGLPPAKGVVKDMLKSYRRILGNRSDVISAMEKDIWEAFQEIDGRLTPESAGKILEIIKRYGEGNAGRKIGTVLARYGFKGDFKKIDFKKLRKSLPQEALFRRAMAVLKGTRIWKAGKSIQSVYDGSMETAAKSISRNAAKTRRIYTPEQMAAMGVSESRTVVGTLQEVTLPNGTKKFVLSVPVETIKSGLKTGIATGVMTLLFDETMTVYGFSQGKISEADFQRETIGNCGKALVNGTATFVAVILGASPHGWVVIGVGLGTYYLCDLGYKGVCRWIDGPGFELEDIIGQLPTEIQRRQTAFSYEGYEALLKYQGRASAFDAPSGESVFDEPSAESPFDYSGHDSAFDAISE